MIIRQHSSEESVVSINWYFLAAHWHLGDVMVSIITFLMIFLPFSIVSDGIYRRKHLYKLHFLNL